MLKFYERHGKCGLLLTGGLLRRFNHAAAEGLTARFAGGNGGLGGRRAVTRKRGERVFGRALDNLVAIYHIGEGFAFGIVITHDLQAFEGKAGIAFEHLARLGHHTFVKCYLRRGLYARYAGIGCIFF